MYLWLSIRLVHENAFWALVRIHFRCCQIRSDKRIFRQNPQTDKTKIFQAFLNSNLALFTRVKLEMSDLRFWKSDPNSESQPLIPNFTRVRYLQVFSNYSIISQGKVLEQIHICPKLTRIRSFANVTNHKTEPLFRLSSVPNRTRSGPAKH